MDISIPEVPDDLTTLTDDELATMESELAEAFQEVHDSGSRDIGLMTGLADSLDTVRAEQSRRANLENETDEQIAALVERVAATEDSDVPEADQTPDEDDPDAPPAETDDDDEDEDETTTQEATAVRQPIAASNAPAARPALREVARRTRQPAVPAARPQVTITAAAEVRGHRNGGRMNLTQVAEAMHDRARHLGDGAPRALVASIHEPHPILASTDKGEMTHRINQLLAGRTEDASALVASGGWCAPTVPVFELFDISDAAGLYDLPTLGGGGPTRGGISVPQFLGMSAAQGALWTWTEANDIAAATQPAGPDKTCLKIPCPTWIDCIPEAEGLCVTHGNLADRAWPELTTTFINLVMNAHLHRLSAAKIAKVVATAVAVTPAAGGLNSDAAGDILNVLDLQVADLRSQHRAGPGRVVEVVAPDWLVPALRANVAKRAGVDMLDTTEADVVSWFTARNVRPQFVSDYQPLYNTTPALNWPATVKLLMHFSGAYISVDAGTIDLGVVRDSVLNSTNDFTAAWSETFYCVTQRGPAAREVTVALDVSGVTACCP